MATSSLLPALPLHSAELRSANDIIHVGLIGVGVRGKYLLANLPDSVRVTAVCDFSLSQIDSARKPSAMFRDSLAKFVERDADRCVVHQDYRKMLEKPNFDAVIIATPDHHHASAAIRAMAAGCHVYVEKPLAVTIHESRAMVQAGEKYRRVVQVGSQQRSMATNRRACEFLRDGGLGKIHLVEERNMPGPMPYEPSKYPAQRPPRDLDWDLFCGPTALRDYHPDLWIKDAYKKGDLLWRGWDLFRDYSGHIMTNWGAHSIDMVQYALGMDQSGPVTIQAKPSLDAADDGNWREKTPPRGTVDEARWDQLRFWPVEMTYASGTILRFTSKVSKTIFHGERGRLTMSRNEYEIDPPHLLAPPDPKEQAIWDGTGHVARPHLENWLEAIRGNQSVRVPLETGHRSITVCHLANIARELNQPLRWDPMAEKFIDNPQANELLSRPRRPGYEIE